MAVDSYYPPPELSTSPEKTEADTAAVRLASDSTPDPGSKPNPHDNAPDSTSLKKMGLPDVQLVDENSPASNASGSEKPGEPKTDSDKPVTEKPAAEKPAVEKPAAEKPAAEKPAAEKPPAENPGLGEPTEAPKASDDTTPQNGPAATDPDSATQPEQSAGNKPSSQAGGAENVIKDVLDGVGNEVDNHSGRLVGDAAVGAGITIGGTVAVATLAAATAPVWGTVAVGVAAVGAAAYGIDKLSKDLPGWIHDAKVADKPSNYTAQADQQAEAGLNQLGGGIADSAAGALGGVDGAAFAGGLVSGLGLTSTLVGDVSGATDRDAAGGLEKTPTDTADPPKSQAPEQNNSPQQTKPEQPKNSPDDSTSKSGKDESQPENKQAPKDDQATKPANTEGPKDNQAAKPGNSADDKAEPPMSKSGSDAKSADASDSAPKEQPVIADSQNPSDYVRQKYGPAGALVANAYDMAKSLLGEDVQGIAGSYARGEARIGQWPVDNYADAAALDKMPEKLDASVLKAMSPEFQDMYNLRQQFPSIPSDLDVVVGGNQSNLAEIAQQIFNSTGVLVEFCSP